MTVQSISYHKDVLAVPVPHCAHPLSIPSTTAATATTTTTTTTNSTNCGSLSTTTVPSKAPSLLASLLSLYTSTISKKHLPPPPPLFVGSLTAYSFVARASKYLSLQLHPTTPAPATDSLPNLSVLEKVFYSAQQPGITIEAYMRRLVVHSNCSPSAFIVALVLLDRFREVQPHLKLSQLNVHRLLITTLMVAAKTTDDRSATPRFFALVGGMPTIKEITHLEASFLSLVQYRVFVSPLDYERKLKEIEGCR